MARLLSACFLGLLMCAPLAAFEDAPWWQVPLPARYTEKPVIMGSSVNPTLNKCGPKQYEGVKDDSGKALYFWGYHVEGTITLPAPPCGKTYYYVMELEIWDPNLEWLEFTWPSEPYEYSAALNMANFSFDLFASKQFGLPDSYIALGTDMQVLLTVSIYDDDDELIGFLMIALNDYTIPPP
jgi:hypothetical protein